MALGLKVTVKVQVPPGLSATAQPLVATRNSVALVPVIGSVDTVWAFTALLVTVKVLAEVAFPRNRTLPKSCAAGLTDSTTLVRAEMAADLAEFPPAASCATTW